MTPLLWRVSAGLVLLVLAFTAGWRVEAGRVALRDKAALEAREAFLRAEIDKRNIEIQRREQVNADTERAYVAKLKLQSADLDRARADLRTVRLRRSACPGVPEAPAAGATPGDATAASTGELARDAAEDLGRLASRCDATAAQLNSLIHWLKEPHP